MLANSIKKKLKIKITKRGLITLLVSFIILAFSLGLTYFNFHFLGKIYPRVSVAGVSLDSKTKKEAIEKLNQNIKPPAKVTLLAKDQNFELSLADVGFSFNFTKSANDAFTIYRERNPIVTFLISPLSLVNDKKLTLQPSIDKNKLAEYLQIISTKLSLEPKSPQAFLLNGNVQVDKGAPGEIINGGEFTKVLLNKLAAQDYSATEIPFIVTDPVISDEVATTFKKRAESLIGKGLSLHHEYDTFNLSDKELMSFLDAKDSFNNQLVDEYINKELLEKVNREPQNAVFNFKDGKVIEFKPARNGATININLLKNQLYQKITTLETTDQKNLSLEIPIESAPPKITTEQVNNLGIKELLGRGTSKFKGSISGRIYNIGLASSKINGALVPPGEVFSFNKTVGDISTLTGYKQAYIIKDGRTVLGDGGGVCQVSTTLFRAALNAGFPIVERHAHSYRVGYYEQDSAPGIDATVFSPTSDLKFKNDTSGYLLIQTIFDLDNVSLAFEIYGTSDGRVATISKPTITSVTAPPDDLYIDDPTLPAGTIKQIDHKAWGAKVNFKYTVIRSGETLIDETFYSNYQPWQSVFLRGTGI
jgi:vancomycin resistance protein YoaR